MDKMIFILSNLRSIYNVGSIFRSADAFGIDRLYLVGTTPHPHPDEPWRRDHLALKKTALGAEETVPWEYHPDTPALITQLKQSNFKIIALETSPDALPLPRLHLSSGKVEVAAIGVVVGNEVTGLPEEILTLADIVVQIPMRGTKESLNVAVAAGIAMHWVAYQITLHPGVDAGSSAI